MSQLFYNLIITLNIHCKQPCHNLYTTLSHPTAKTLYAFCIRIAMYLYIYVYVYVCVYMCTLSYVMYVCEVYCVLTYIAIHGPQILHHNIIMCACMYVCVQNVTKLNIK